MISVIVPVYNAEKYLHQCVNSVLDQTFTDFELLLIDDGSTDSSGVICDKYATEDNRIRVFHKENGGVSSARNLGLDNAKGEYLIFLDADDYWCDLTALEQMHNIAVKNDVDIVRGEYKAVNENGEDLFSRIVTQSKKNIENKIINSATFLKDAVCGEYFFVLCLVKRATLGSLRYNINRCFLEDMELLSNLMLKSPLCVYLPLRFYAYRKLATSASSVVKRKNIEDAFAMCYMFNDLANKTKDAEIGIYYRYYSIMMYHWTLDSITLEAYFPQRKDIIKELCLIDLRKNVCKWSKKSNKRYPITIDLSPIIGVWILKIKHSVGNFIRKFR